MFAKQRATSLGCGDVCFGDSRYERSRILQMCNFCPEPIEPRCRLSQFSIAIGVVITESVWKVAPVTRLPYALAKSVVGVRAVTVDDADSLRYHLGLMT